MGKMRKEFDAFAGYMDLDRSYFIGNDNEFTEYVDYSTSLAWKAWKDSRAAMCAEMPLSDCHCEMLTALKVAQGFIEQAIEVSGFGECTLRIVNDAIIKAEGVSK